MGHRKRKFAARAGPSIARSGLHTVNKLLTVLLLRVTMCRASTSVGWCFRKDKAVRSSYCKTRNKPYYIIFKRPVRDVTSCVGAWSNYYYRDPMQQSKCVCLYTYTLASMLHHVDASLQSVWIVHPTLRPRTSLQARPMHGGAKHRHQGIQSETKASTARDLRDTDTGAPHTLALGLCCSYLV